MSRLTARQLFIAYNIYTTGAFKDKPKSPDGKGFKLKLHEKSPEAPLSPFYLNLRTPENPKPGPLILPIVNAIGEWLNDKAHEEALRYTYVAGIPNAGNPLAEAFVKADTFPYLELLKLIKEEHVGHRKISGVTCNYTKGRTVILIDDIITKANSKLEAIDSLEQAGLRVKDVLVIIDREQGGKEQLQEKGYDLHSLLKISELVELYFSEGLLKKENYEEIKNYLANNK